MKYEDVKDLKLEEFRRLTGVKPDTFKKMLCVLETAEAKRKAAQRYRGGKKPKLTLADQLMLTLCYLREYRTQFHVSKSYGLHETHCGRIIRHVEDTLMKSREFTLPGKKALLASNIEYQVVVIDAINLPAPRGGVLRSSATQAARLNGASRRYAPPYAPRGGEFNPKRD